MNRLLAVLLLALALGACSQQDQSAGTQQAPQTGAAGTQAQNAMPPGHPPLNAGAGAVAGAGQAAPGRFNRGKVLNVLQSAGYYYVEVEVEGKPVWLASNQAQATVGEEVAWGEYAVMRNFVSKSLDRTFPVILFVNALAPASAVAAPAASQGTVLTLLTGGGYSYAEVETGSGKTWIAAPQVNIRVGDRIAWSGGAPMRNFSSSSLGRTFDVILFVGGVQAVN